MEELLRLAGMTCYTRLEWWAVVVGFFFGGFSGGYGWDRFWRSVRPARAQKKENPRIWPIGR